MFAMKYLQQQGGGWVWYVILGILLLLLIIWWLFSRRKAEQVTPTTEVRVPNKQAMPTDDLTKLEGIGPKVAKVLNDAGITTFAALANAKADDIQKTLNAAGLQMMNPEGWIDQAVLAAKGDWVELEKLQDKLKGGRRK